MLLLCKWGVYVIDRSFRIRRVQMRCIVPGPKHEPHHMTLLDGEMVVDEDSKTGTCRRRYLAYDMMVLNQKVLADRPFKERTKMLQEYVIAPRDKERAQPGQRHLYDKEDFGLRHKTFSGLDMTQSLLTKFIQKLTHESDGLIFQPGDDPYVPATCEELLKWKFASMNSVDFLLQRTPTGGFQLCLLHSRGGQPALMKPLADAKVVFPEGHEPSEYVNRVIECSWDADASAWQYMRHRLDKETPNAYHVYEKVLRSIQDNITEEDLIQYVAKPQSAGQPAELLPT
jgi:mRNA-capping enzyme